jgi:hypothetical protein
MTPETPAEGILKLKEFEDAKTYQVVCECGADDHNHTVWVETDSNSITVTTYTKQKSRFWEQSRWSTIWTLLIQGYVEYEASIIMTRQQALNYAATLEQAVTDLTQKD